MHAHTIPTAAAGGGPTIPVGLADPPPPPETPEAALTPGPEDREGTATAVLVPGGGGRD
jgi:hypothetical protein